MGSHQKTDNVKRKHRMKGIEKPYKKIMLRRRMYKEKAQSVVQQMKQSKNQGTSMMFISPSVPSTIHNTTPCNPTLCVRNKTMNKLTWYSIKTPQRNRHNKSEEQMNPKLNAANFNPQRKQGK